MKYIYATKINYQCDTGIINVENREILCLCSKDNSLVILQGLESRLQHSVTSEEKSYECTLEGGKDKCGFKSKDFIACVALRHCEYAKTTIK